jgi:lipid II:glycine glycyltransferase (peptidoglycan interpeptide bridge formation enzyme)
MVTLFFGATATYLYGASSDEKRHLMPSYALQWAAIKAAKAAGCLEYDMYGIPPTNDDQHPMAGLYRFKTGFGGGLRHYPGAWDYVYLPFVYTLFRSAERSRLLWHKKIRKNRH